ncbi:tetratricopeptide (TPR) repeat protein [Chryseobacterium sp. SLBN-27]|uniref:tetratricopeptide repeat protein n=1 Tax=Chryseobacterium sp. SLBN-27 TaxID=3042287 RepID=UPI002860AD06|nr:tetratricopeptide repeat protein [Chryseobacterium sp. SLBN-27]MDR6157316.1 tetratricopeptide (TPR) repeat protein [Chryseobacterium sp. SLBN-27]
MKKLLIIFMLMLSIKGFSQDFYFSGKMNYCTPENPESKKSFETAFIGLNYPKYYNSVTALLLKVAEKDPKFCDAYFMAGYFFRLQEMHKEALALYYIADSLSQNKAPIFKQNLAIQFMRFGKVDKAREKYEEMVKYFPDNPEGFYGIGNTSITIGDYDKGIENLKLAEDIYKKSGKVKDDVTYMYGMLYSLKENYDIALPYLEDAYSTYKKDDGYLSLYALALIKVGRSKNDEKLIKKAQKTYDKVKDKVIVPEIRKKLTAEFS